MLAFKLHKRPKRFEIGDTVIVVNGSNWFKEGAIGTVTQMTGSLCFVHFTKGNFDPRCNAIWCSEKRRLRKYDGP